MIPYCILVIEDDSDRVFMETLFLEYQRLMYSEINKILQNAWDTEDVMQATLVKLIDKIPELRKKERKKLINYIITASKNTALNYLRDNKHKALIAYDEINDPTDDDQDGRLFEMQLIMKEEVEDLRLKWPMLDERSRYLLESKYILGKHDDDIAIELGMKAGSVRMALTRARKNAYRLLSSEAVKSGEA